MIEPLYQQWAANARRAKTSEVTPRDREYPEAPHHDWNGTPLENAVRNGRGYLKGAWWIRRPEVGFYLIACSQAAFFRRWG
jgi:hypothetical protein